MFFDIFFYLFYFVCSNKGTKNRARGQKQNQAGEN